MPVPVPLPVPDPVLDARTPHLLDGTSQLVLGVADGWDSPRATLQRYERDGDQWRAVGDPVDVGIGMDGLAWGLGLHGDGAPADASGPLKREGDERSPAGAFRISRELGEPPAGLGGLPYQHTDEHWRCVDDAASAHYAQILDDRGVTVDWQSAETMHQPAYRRVVVIDHNAAAVPGGGSCIFFHEGDGATDGCTSMPRADLDALLAWLQPGAVYVLLPREARDALAASWGLP